MFKPNNVLSETDAKNMNSQVLAFVGDAVYTLYIRTYLAENFKLHANKLHTLCSKYVQAKGQSDSIKTLINMFNETELAVFKRARNYKTANVAKNADVLDYKRATGFEAVVGFLYLSGNVERLEQILSIAKDSVNYEN